jgi:hypothetical protein
MPRLLLAALVALLALAPAASAQNPRVAPRLDLGAVETAPFPNDRWTVRDTSQRTGRRVALPRPDCTANQGACQDVDVLNTLDGFDLQPRVTIPFTGAIDLASVRPGTVFLVPARGRGGRVPVGQVSWDPETTTLRADPVRLLGEGRRYLLVVTRDVQTPEGRRIGRAAGALGAAARAALRRAGIARRRVAVAALFTTRTATWLMDRISRQVEAADAPATRFDLGAGGERTVFARAALTGITFNRQTGTAPAFTPAPVPVALLGDAVGTLAFGSYRSTQFIDERERIPFVPSRTRRLEPQGTEEVAVTVFLPSGERPAGGWPVAIFGHGFTDSRFGAPFTVARTMAEAGLATVAINVVGHGGGPEGTLAVQRTDGGPVTLPAGGRGEDQNADGAIGNFEGVNAEAPYELLSSTDGLNQTVADLLQLTKAIRGGVDVDGDGRPDLDGGRITYAGQSFGGIYGTEFLGASRAVRVGVPNVPGGPIIEIARLSPSFRPLVTLSLAARDLLNGGPNGGAEESIPLRGQPPVVQVPGASAIQRFLDQVEWASQTSNPVAWAPRLRERPLPGLRPRRVIIQYARGDRTVPNPTTANIIRAGRLADRATLLRADLAFAQDPAFGTNPHAFLSRIASPGLAGTVARQGQEQIATFLASNGRRTIDPDGAGPLFETPVAGPPPEDLGFYGG